MAGVSSWARKDLLSEPTECAGSGIRHEVPRPVLARLRVDATLRASSDGRRVPEGVTRCRAQPGQSSDEWFWGDPLKVVTWLTSRGS